MPADMHQAVEPGDLVRGDDIRRTGQYTVLRNARINGESFPLLTLLHTQHFSPATSTTDPMMHRHGLVSRLSEFLRRGRRER